MNRLRRKDAGNTLLETVIALSISAVLGIFFSSFLLQQTQLYYQYDKASLAERMCSQAYYRLEQKLRYGYAFYVDPGAPNVLSCYIRTSFPNKKDREEEILPRVEKWDKIRAEDLEIEAVSGLSLELDFCDTTQKEAHVDMKVFDKDKLIYSQKALIRSMYDYEIESGGAL